MRMNSCETCKKYRVCKWKDEVVDLLKVYTDRGIPTDSPLSIIIHCMEFERRNEGIR